MLRMQPARIARSAAKSMLSWLTSPQVACSIGQPLFRLMGRPSKSKEENLDLLRAERVLIVRVDKIGDVVTTIPFLRELRRNLPEAWISLVVQPQVHNLVEHCPYINEVLTYDWNTSEVRRELRQLRRHGRALRLARQRLWPRHFDLAILPRWDRDYHHASFIVYLSGAPLRVGYSEKVNPSKKHANRGFDCLFTHVLEDPALRHEVEYNLEILRFLHGKVHEDRLELFVIREDEALAKEVLQSSGVRSEELLVALCPGAGAPKRMWPLSNFITVGAWLQHTYCARIVVVGGPGEESLGEDLQRHLGEPLINTVGELTLRQTAALLRHCRLYVGNDCGVMHLAAAAGVPVVEISCHPRFAMPSHPFSPHRWRPWGVPHHVIQPESPLDPACSDACHAEHAHCILGVTVEQVQQAVNVQLAKGNLSGGNAQARDSL